MKILGIVLFLLGIESAFGQIPVPASWNFYSNTGSNASIVVPSTVASSLSNRSLQSGDAIGVFYTRNDSLLCAGYGVWNAGQNLPIVAWGDNDQTAIKDGFAPAETIAVKMWDAVAGREYVSNVVFETGSNTFARDGIYIISSIVAGQSKPVAPTLVSPSDGATGMSSSPSLVWNASAGAASYQLQVSTNAGFTVVVADRPGLTSTTSTVTNLASNTAYYWRVRAANTAGTSAWSATRNFSTTTVVPSIPAAPVLVSPADGATAVSITPSLTWNASAGASAYQVQVSANASFSTLIVNQQGLSSTSHAAAGLSNNTMYYWRVNASNSAGTSTWSATHYFTTEPAVSDTDKWVQTSGSSGSYVLTLAVFGTNLFAGTGGQGIFLSANSGKSWTGVNNGLTNSSVSTIVVSGSTIIAGTSSGVYRSTNTGSSWGEVNAGLANSNVSALAVLGTEIFAGTYGGVFRSADYGTSWTQVNTGLTNTFIAALAVSGTDLYAGTYGGGIFLSTNSGKNWTAVNTGLTDNSVTVLAASGTTIFAAGSRGGIFRSKNKGANWTAVNAGLTNTNVKALAIAGVKLFAGTSKGIFLSTNEGAAWTEVTAGLTNTSISSLCAGSTQLFAGTSDGVWRRSLSGMVTAVEQRQVSDLPDHFIVRQNYPNPFNPSTTIAFSLPYTSFVTLKIFDVMGREVEAVVSGELPPGNHTRRWNAAGLPSGTYFYRLQAGSSVTTKRLLLLR